MTINKITSERVIIKYEAGEDSGEFNLEVRGYLHDGFKAEEVFVLNNSFCVSLCRETGIDDIYQNGIMTGSKLATE